MRFINYTFLVIMGIMVSCSDGENPPSEDLTNDELVEITEDYLFDERGGILNIVNNASAVGLAVNSKYRTDPLSCGESDTRQRTFERNGDRFTSYGSSTILYSLNCNNNLPSKLTAEFFNEGQVDAVHFKSQFSGSGIMEITDIVDNRTNPEFTFNGQYNRVSTVTGKRKNQMYDVEITMEMENLVANASENKIVSGEIVASLTAQIDGVIITEKYMTLTISAENTITLNTGNFTRIIKIN